MKLSHLLRVAGIATLIILFLASSSNIISAKSFDDEFFLPPGVEKVSATDQDQDKSNTKDVEKNIISDEDDEDADEVPNGEYFDQGIRSLTETDLPFISGMKGYSVFRAPTLAISKKGTVLAFCEGRVDGHQDEGDMDIVLRRSHDNGKTWEKMQVLEDDGKNPCKLACPVVLDSGRILVLWAWNKSIPNEKARKKLPYPSRPVFLTYSDDDGKTWSKSRDITSMVYGKGWGWSGLGPCHGIVKRREPNQGRIVFAARHNPGDTKGRSHVIYSDDEGKTWQIGGSALQRSSESTVVELSNGEIMLSSRNQDNNSNYRLVSLSRDGGKTFYTTYEEKAHVEPRGCQGSLLFHSINKKTGKGNIIFSNPRHPEWRANGCLQLSEDDGQTWTKRRRYSGKPLKFSGYSDIALINGTDIAVLFERGGEPKLNKKGKYVKGTKGDRYDRIGFKIIPFSALIKPENMKLVRENQSSEKKPLQEPTSQVKVSTTAPASSVKNSPEAPTSSDFSNFSKLPPEARQKLSLSRGKGAEKGLIKIRSSSPMDHTTGLVMRTTPLNQRVGNRNAVTGFHLDSGIYSSWKFVGSKGSDTIHFGSQGVIISKRTGGVVDFGSDDKKDVFIFENRINLERKPDHHPLNHLQKIVIRNFGKEDEIIIQGKKYGYNDISKNLLPGIGSDRLQIFKLGE